ncbi:MAG TPA: pilin [Candidatus Tyrphobacter sp.]|nr:pilin [Candidatus Tyrphobacter sp.]
MIIHWFKPSIKIFITLALAAATVQLFYPAPSYAACTSDSCGAGLYCASNGNCEPYSPSAPTVVNCDSSSGNIQICPPTGLPTDVQTLFKSIQSDAIYILTPLSALMVLWAAFLFLTSGGDEKKVKTAKNLLLYTVIGIAVILVADGIVSVVKDLLNVNTPTP